MWSLQTSRPCYDVSDKSAGDAVGGRKNDHSGAQDKTLNNGVTMPTCPLDRGHRLGNFHNYYFFHPIEARLEPLLLGRSIKGSSVGHSSFERYEHASGTLIDFIVKRFFEISRAENNGDMEKDGCTDWPCKKIEKTCSQHCCCRTDDVQDCGRRSFFYCDLGCNEGDLSLAIANHVAQGIHRYHMRVRKQQILLKKNAQCSDVSCKISQAERPVVASLGLDIDPVLVARARQKSTQTIKFVLDSQTNEKESVDLRVEADFQVCNLCDRNAHFSSVEAFWNGNDVEQSTLRPSVDRNVFDLTTLFSTTMWIHVHAGDDGLRSFLQRTCARTKMLLVEPQPSRCYRSINMRLRKMKRPGVDLSGLAMRPSIEKEIEEVVIGCGFRRVTAERIAGETNARSSAWGRSLQLYESMDFSHP